MGGVMTTPSEFCRKCGTPKVEATDASCGKYGAPYAASVPASPDEPTPAGPTPVEPPPRPSKSRPVRLMRLRNLPHRLNLRANRSLYQQALIQSQRHLLVSGANYLASKAKLLRASTRVLLPLEEAPDSSSLLLLP